MKNDISKSSLSPLVTEKLLESLLAYNKQHFTKTHDINKLILAIKTNDIAMIYDTEKLINLTGYAIIQNDIENTNIYIDILEKLTLHIDKIIKKEKD